MPTWADIYAGLAIGFVAALASRTWRGLLTFVLGLLTAGATAGIVYVFNRGSDAGGVVFATLHFAFWLGLLGIPTYLVITGIAYLVRAARR